MWIFHRLPCAAQQIWVGLNFLVFDTEFGFTRYSPRLDDVGITWGEWQQKDIEHFISAKISFNDNEYIEIILWPVV